MPATQGQGFCLFLVTIGLLLPATALCMVGARSVLSGLMPRALGDSVQAQHQPAQDAKGSPCLGWAHPAGEEYHPNVGLGPGRFEGTAGRETRGGRPEEAASWPGEGGSLLASAGSGVHPVGRESRKQPCSSPSHLRTDVMGTKGSEASASEGRNGGSLLC